MAYKVLGIYKDLPGTNCGDCGRASCFAFASAVYLEGVSPAGCPHLGTERLQEMAARMDEERRRGGGKKAARSEQALSHLQEVISGLDLEWLATRCGARYFPGPPAAVEVPFLGEAYRVSRQGVSASGAEQPTVWTKIFLMIYVTRADGSVPDEDWVAYRELPNTVSKAKSFEACADRIAAAYEGREEELVAAAADLGGREIRFGSATHALRFQALPRVALLFLYWGEQEEFPARATLLMNRGVLGYLDQEALVFLAEAFANRLLGGSVAEVIP